jgi:hypothetical protein
MRTKIQNPITRAYMYVLCNRVTLSPIHTNTLIYKDKRGDIRGDIGVTCGVTKSEMSPRAALS